MRITSFPLGPIETNSYILDNGRDALSIDVGGDPAPILAFLQREKLTLLAILVTHRHFDHLYGIHALQEALHVPAYVPTGDDCIAETESSRGGIWGMPLVPDFEATPLPGKNLIIGSFACRVLLTPGHTPGGVSYYFEKAKAVFTGDAPGKVRGNDRGRSPGVRGSGHDGDIREQGAGHFRYISGKSPMKGFSSRSSPMFVSGPWPG